MNSPPFHIERKKLSDQVADQLMSMIADGTFRPGDRLPSVRALAAELSVNQNTILRVYERLTAEGLLERRHGQGTFVADHVPSGQMDAQKEVLYQQIAQVTELAKTLGIDIEEVHRLLDEMWK